MMKSIFRRNPVLSYKSSPSLLSHTYVNSPESSDPGVHYHKKVLLLGAPGVGKGSYASRACKTLDIPHLAAGDIIRDEITKETPLGKQLQSYTNQGKLVPDKIVVEMIMSHIGKLDASKGYVLDGFPRTIHQAQVLDQFVQMDLVINLTQREDIIVQKITNRRVCRSCGANYNLAHIKEEGIDMPPLVPEVEGVCDHCGAKDSLYQRDDDKEEVVRHRLVQYKESTEPLVEFYADKGVLKTFRINGGVKHLLPSFLDVMHDRVKN